MSLRRAALHLHGLHERDRGWILENLAEHERDRLTELLSELTELGIPPLAETLVTEAPKAVDAAMADSLEHIDRAKRKDVEALLAPVPDHVVAAILRHRPWRWAGRIARKRPRVRSLLQDAELGGAGLKNRTIDQLLQSLATHLPATSRHRAPDPEGPH